MSTRQDRRDGVLATAVVLVVGAGTTLTWVATHSRTLTAYVVLGLATLAICALAVLTWNRGDTLE